MKCIAEKILKCRKCSDRVLQDSTIPLPHLDGSDYGMPKLNVLAMAPGHPVVDKEYISNIDKLDYKSFYKFYKNDLVTSRFGKFMDTIFKASGISWDEVFYTNVIKCHPYQNKVYPEMIENCLPYLNEQLEKVTSKNFLLIGSLSCKSIGIEEKVSNIHGKIIEIKDKKYIPMLHPSFIWRSNKLEQENLSKRIINSLKEIL